MATMPSAKIVDLSIIHYMEQKSKTSSTFGPVKTYAETYNMEQETMTVRIPYGTVMVDTGCRRAVGGAAWHAQLQDELDKKQMPYTCKVQRE